jgi:zinc finger CCHC domain-containing protein 9
MTRFARYKKSFNGPEISQKLSADASVNKHASADKDKRKKGFEMRQSWRGSPKPRQHSTGTTCLRCRKPGHTLKDCTEPSKGTAQEAEFNKSGYCYNCGSHEHTHKQCTLPYSNFAHAVCFFCDQKGHLASACTQNDRGIYPNGGCCHHCGSTKHLARNCRPTDSAKNGEVLISAASDPQTNPENDDVYEALQKIQQERQTFKQDTHKQTSQAKAKKIVTFK